MCRAVFGIKIPDSGQIRVDGRRLELGFPSAAINAGIGYVPRERGDEGLVLYLSIGPNITLPNLGEVVRRGFLNHKLERKITEDWIDRLDIRTSSPSALCMNLSGGNQQKVVLAKWLASQVKMLILDHPTRGLDVGAKEEVYDLVRGLAKQGVSMLLISDTLEETIGLSNTILTMKDGSVTHRFEAPGGNKPQPVDLIRYMM